MTTHPEMPRPGVPRPELARGHPEFDAFLSAPVGEDAAGVGLSVMSALARLGLDPWSEAARLADLPRDAAAAALALTLGKLPAGSWTPAGDMANLVALAQRLADCLPRSHRLVDAPGRPGAAAKTVSGPMLWLLYGAIAVGFYMLFSQLQPDYQLEPASRASTQQ